MFDFQEITSGDQDTCGACFIAMLEMGSYAHYHRAIDLEIAFKSWNKLYSVTSSKILPSCKLGARKPNLKYASP